MIEIVYITGNEMSIVTARYKVKAEDEKRLDFDRTTQRIVTSNENISYTAQ